MLATNSFYFGSHKDFENENEEEENNGRKQYRCLKVSETNFEY